jgi:hypothetical protein
VRRRPPPAKRSGFILLYSVHSVPISCKFLHIDNEVESQCIDYKVSGLGCKLHSTFASPLVHSRRK